MSNQKITIPEPCHEGWHKMQPNKEGRFCNSCEKTVVDFTQMKREEIQDFFVAKRGEKICGHFRASQVEVPKPWLHQKLNRWYAHVQHGISVRFFRVAFLACISLCMMLVGCKNDQQQGQQEQEMTVDGGIGPNPDIRSCDPEERLTGDTIYIPNDHSTVEGLIQSE